MSSKASSAALLPSGVVYFCGAAGALTLALAELKLSDYGLVETWRGVFIPSLAALTGVFLLFTISVVVWISVAVKLLNSPMDMEYESDSFNLDMLFRTAKVCFLGHTYCTLLCIAAYSMMYKLENWDAYPLLYPCGPLLVLGSVHILLAILFKEPEIDAGRSSFIGVSMLGHSVMFILMFDNHFKSSISWAAVFLPSWLTYVGVLLVCILQGVVALRHSSPELSIQMAEAGVSRDEAPNLYLLVGLAVWALGFGSSQVLYTLQLDGHWKGERCPACLVPAIVGLGVLTVCAAGPVGRRFADVVRTFMDAYAAQPPDEDDPKQPLMGEEEPNRLPWR